eukprot:COSAG06_NODE_60712_length_270_cov_0.596491_1_plen_28_part_10
MRVNSQQQHLDACGMHTELRLVACRGDG